jgi:hypothetical protein
MLYCTTTVDTKALILHYIARTYIHVQHFTGVTTLYGIREQSSRCTATNAVGRSPPATVMGGLTSMAKTPTVHTANFQRKSKQIFCTDCGINIQVNLSYSSVAAFTILGSRSTQA